MNMKMSSRVILAAALAASAGSAGMRASIAPATKVLHFPRDQYMGSLYIKDPCLGSEYAELGRDLSLPYGLDPTRVALGGDDDFVGLARGDVALPAGRNVKLLVILRLPQDRNRLATLPPLQYQMFGTDRCHEDPEDLSGLSMLDPDDLSGIVVNRLIPTNRAGEQILKPISRLTGLRVLQLHKTGVTDRDMEYLRPLRSLGALELAGESSLGNRGLAVLKDLPNLEYLDLDTGATDVGFKFLGQLPRLRWMRIRTGRIWGPGLAELARAPKLERLCLWGDSEISDRHIQYLEGLTRLRSLTLWGCYSPLTDASLASIAKLRDLEELHFIGWGGWPTFTPAGVAHLQNLKHLRKLEFGPTWAGPAGVQYGDEVARLLAGMPDLESIRAIGYLSDEGMKALATLPKLRCLHVALKDRRQGYDGPTGLSELAGLGSLGELFFTGGKSLSDADLADLASMTGLRRLLLSGDEITDEGMVSLGKLKQLEYLHVSLSGVTKKGLTQVKDLRNLQTLYVRVHPDATLSIDEIPLDLSSLTNLKTLDLAGFALGESDLAGVSGLHHLEWMMLQNNDFPETSLRHLKDLPALKRLDINGIQCSDGSGLASLGGLTGLGDLTVRGRITDRAFSRLASVSSAWSLSAWTNEPIRPETINHLKRTLPNIEYVHIHPLPEWNREGPGIRSQQRERGPSSPARTTRPTPQNPRRGR